MGDNVIYIRSTIPAGFVPLNDEIIDDLRKFVQLDDDLITAADKRLAQLSTFSNRKQLRVALEDTGDDEHNASLLFRVFNWANEIRRSDGDIDQIVKNLRRIKSPEDGGTPPFSEGDLEKLQTRLRGFFAHAVGNERQIKAEKLAAATGQRLQHLRLICDLRPIFDGKRDAIVGAIPLTTLKVVCEGADGLPVSIEAILSERDVGDLYEMAAMAKKKLAGIRQLAQKMGLQVPEMDLTKQARENDAE